MQKLLKDLPAEQKKLVEDLIPSVATATTVQRVLQALLKERVSIRDLPTILEGIAEAAPHTSSITNLVEPCARAWPAALLAEPRRRRRLADHHPVAGVGAGLLRGPDRRRARTSSWRWRRRKLQEFIRGVRESLRARRARRRVAVLLTGPAIRPYVRSIIERFRGQTVVMSQNEIHPKARLKTWGGDLAGAC